MKTVAEQAEALEQAQSAHSYAKSGVSTREFASNQELRAKLAKHHRMDRDPRDKNLLPLTTSHGLGWQQPTTAIVRKPTRSCEETRYASAMVKAGVYYY